MGAQRVLDREVMQPEALLHRVQQRLIRFVQTDPDEATVAGVNLARLVQIDIRDPASALIGRTVDHHALFRAEFGRWSSGCFVHLVHQYRLILRATVFTMATKGD